MFSEKSCFGSGLGIVLKTKSMLKTLETRSEVYRKTLVNAQIILRKLKETKSASVQNANSEEKPPTEQNDEVAEEPKQPKLSKILDKLKTQKQTVSFQRSSIFTVYQQIADLRKAETQKSQKSIAENEPEPNGLIYERDAIAILPEEVWKMVMEYLTECRDLQACYRTCTLFWNILNKTIGIWMFPKVFPYVIDYLNESEINTCRLLSKEWNTVVSNTRPRRLQLDFPLTPAARIKLEKLKDVKSTDYLAKYYVGIFAEDDNQTEDHEETAMLTDICQFLTTHGSTIANLEMELMTDLLDVHDVAGIVIEALNTCTQLKKLIVNAKSVPENDEELTSEILDILLPEGFRVPTTLTKLDIWGDANLGALLSRILQDCQPHLEEFQFDEWAAPENEWPNLAKLISRIELNPVAMSTWQMNLNFFNSLMRSSMPNLYTLEVSVMQGFLEYLLETSNRFPKLGSFYLHLYHSGFSGFLSSEYLELPEGVYAPTSVKELQMHVLVLNGLLDLSFLLFFPFTETLQITFNNMDFPELLSETDEPPNVIEISELLTVETVYLSDIWKFLPFLKHLKIGDAKNACRLTCYTRSEYTTFTGN